MACNNMDSGDCRADLLEQMPLAGVNAFHFEAVARGNTAVSLSTVRCRR
jgi:hypothetical protein